MIAQAPPHRRGPRPQASLGTLVADSRAVLFDLDGVLVDSLPVMAIAWEEVRRALGIQTPFEAYAQEIGRPFDDIIRRLGHSRRLAQIRSVYHSASRREHHRIVLYPGVEAMLEGLRNADLVIGVVTSKPREAAVRVLDGCEVRYECLKTPDDGVGKPSPELLNQALAELRVVAGEAVYVGDMEVDREAARTANVEFIHAAWGYGVMNQPTLTATRPTDLLEGALERGGCC